MVSTYNEPLITSEWAVAVFKEAKAAGLVTGFVSNGNATPEVLEYVRPWVDLYKVDLKGFDDRHYRELGGRLQPILDAIRRIHEMGFWLEIVTLLVPGFNDSDDEVRRLAEFIAGVSPDIPWHVTAFHKDYKMVDPSDTRPEDLLRAAAIGKKAGLRYVYAGNLPGRVGDLENTRCPNCRALLVERFGYFVRGYHLTPEGNCPKCAAKIPGRWAAEFRGQITSTPYVPGVRRRAGTAQIFNRF
jgi:pyruvate formate lyase activating enzyme